jgi:uncharacterized membrane protein YdbT with pleckstrin-like domain
VSYVERNLLPGERLLFRTRLHWIMFGPPALLALGGLLLALVLRGVPEVAWLPWLGGVVLLAALGWGLVRYVELRTSEFAVTSARLVFKVGLLARYTTELLLGKVETVGVTQSLAGRLLGFGDLTVTGTGGAREVFHRVHDPIAFRNHVQQASLAADAGAGSREAPAGPGSDRERGSA